MGRRRKARELALQALYSVEMTSDPVKGALENLFRGDRHSPDIVGFCVELSTKTLEHLPELDRLIEQTAGHWKLSRIATIDKIILRMAICEMLHMDDIPPKVSIDEAIELAKKFSTEKSGQFVNGILDAVAKRELKDLS